MVEIVNNILVESACILGESPIWDPQNEILYWVDIVAGKLHRFSIKNQDHQVLVFDQALCAVNQCDDGSLLLAFEKKLAVLEGFDLFSLKYETTILSPGDERFNDGKIDPMGRLWIGTMNKMGKKDHSVLMTVKADLKSKIQLAHLTVSNGMCWNPEGTRFYHIDTAHNQVTAYNYSNLLGEISNPEVIIRIPKKWGKPDGMTIDSQGNLWIALWGGWAVSCWNVSSGDCIGMIDLPVSQVSSCVFGGENLESLYITTAKKGLNLRELQDQPLAGSVFQIKLTGIQGLPSPVFKL